MRVWAAGLMLLLGATWVAMAAAPAGWFLAGSKPGNYETGVDQYALYNGFPSAYLKAKADEEGFGTLMQSFAADRYAGKRVRLSGWVKSDSVTRWSGMWLRVDGAGSPPRPLAFDNMQDRPIRGTTAWQKYEVVLDVPDAATEIAMGVLLDGPGEVWLNSVNVEVVTAAVPTTGNGGRAVTPNTPQNLNFTK